MIHSLSFSPIGTERPFDYAIPHRARSACGKVATIGAYGIGICIAYKIKHHSAPLLAVREEGGVATRQYCVAGSILDVYHVFDILWPCIQIAASASVLYLCGEERLILSKR